MAEPTKHDNAFSLQLVTVKRLLELAAWPETSARLDALIARLQPQLDDTACLLHVAPLRYWLLESGATTIDIREQAVAEDSVAVTDLTHSHTLFRLSGTQVGQVLRKGLPIDLHSAVFAKGSMAASAIEGIRVVIVNGGGHYDLLCPRSFSDSLRHWLLDAALEFTQQT